VLEPSNNSKQHAMEKPIKHLFVAALLIVATGKKAIIHSKGETS
jgi:hypothetical protein